MLTYIRWVFGILIISCLAMTADLSAQQNATDRMISSYQSRVSMFGKDYSNYDKLGAAYIQKGRETGDVTYYDLAEKALSKSLDMVSDEMAAAGPKMHMAVVCMAEHRFEDALNWAQSALAVGSGDLSAWAIVGDALADTGEYDKAGVAYSNLRDPLNPEDPRSPLSYERESRASYLRFVLGDPQGAIQLMRSAINKAFPAHMPGENTAWSQFQLGEEYFQVGDLSNAEKAFQDALQAYPGYYRARAGLAKVRVAQGRYAEAIDLYQKAIAVIPFPEYAAALGDVYKKTNRPAEAKKLYSLVEFIGYLNAINKTLYNRELALFYADHDTKLKEALDLAEKELEVRRDIYTWDVVAWARHKNGKFQESADAMTKALRLGTKDAMLFFHAGMIYHRLGDEERAKDYFRRALATNPHFHIFYADEAERTLRELEGQQKAEGSQQKAESAQGWRDGP